MSFAVQELVALSVVALAAVYIVSRLTGWPRLDVVGFRGGARKACGSGAAPVAPVILGERLRRGLRKRGA